MKKIAPIAALVVGLLTISPLCNIQAQGDDLTVKDEDTRIIDSADLKYPPLARQTRTQGVVVVRVKLDSDGRVVEAHAVSGHALLMPDSIANAKKWRFQPNAQRAAVIVYNFRMPGGGCDSPTSFSFVQAPNFVSITGCDVPIR